jgi:hypothetical protein
MPGKFLGKEACTKGQLMARQQRQRGGKKSPLNLEDAKTSHFRADAVRRGFAAAGIECVWAADASNGARGV